MIDVFFNPDYGYCADAKSSVRRENLNIQTATHDAPRVFFCVYACAHLQTVLYRSDSMVALVGQPKGWLVPVCASILTPASVTAPLERENSGGDSDILQAEIIVMMAITPTQIQFKFRFLAILRADLSAQPCQLETIATTERAARLSFSRDFVLLFAARLPVAGVNHA